MHRLTDDAVAEYRALHYLAAQLATYLGGAAAAAADRSVMTQRLRRTGSSRFR